MSQSIDIQKTYLGKTAGGWLKSAHVAESQAGEWMVWVNHPVNGPVEAILTDSGNLCLNDYSGSLAVLETSGQAYDKLSRLQDETAAKMA